MRKKDNDQIIKMCVSVMMVLIYSDQFGYVLRKKEIEKRLLANDYIDYLVNKKNNKKTYGEKDERLREKTLKLAKRIQGKVGKADLKKISLDDVLDLLVKYEFLEKEEIVEDSDGCFYKPKNGLGDYRLRKKRNKNTDKKQSEIEEFVKLIRKIPLIKAVGVSGSVAVNNTKNKDDLDFLIITEKNCMWIARFLLYAVMLISKRKKLRVGKKHDNGWCLNMWLDESSLKMTEGKTSLYEAYELVQINWVYDIDEMSKNMIIRNKFVKKYLKKIEKPDEKSEDILQKKNSLLLLINKVSYRLQYYYMKNKISNELVDMRQAMFHPIDRSEIVYENIKKKIDKICQT